MNLLFLYNTDFAGHLLVFLAIILSCIGVFIIGESLYSIGRRKINYTGWFIRILGVVILIYSSHLLVIQSIN